MAEAAERDYSLFGDEHIAQYEATDGEVGYLWNGAPCLVLHTKGRKTGELRKFPLIFGERGDDVILVASKGGAPDHPGWYLNLLAHPDDVAVQIKGDVIPVARAHGRGRRAHRAVEPHARAVARLRRLPGQHRPRDPGRGARATLSSWATTTPSTARASADCSISPVRSTPRAVAAFATDPYPEFAPAARDRARARGHRRAAGRLHRRAGFFQGLPYPDRPHWSAFDWATCDAVFRDGDTYVSKPPPEDTPGLTNASILYMDGAEHRRYRALVQPSFLPKRASWWTERWVVGAIDALLDRMEPNGGGDLNVEYFSAIPLLTITGSLGVSVADALDIRQAVTSDGLGIQAFAAHRAADRAGQTRANRATTSSACSSRRR